MIPEELPISIDAVQGYIEAASDGERSRKKYKPTIHWDSVIVKHTTVGEALVIPISYGDNVIVRASDSTKAYNANMASYVFAYKIEEELKVEFVQIVPTSNEAAFTGHITVNPWGEKIKRIMVFEEGVFAREYQDGESYSRGRSTCYEVITYYCTVRPEGPDDCEIVGYAYYCEEPESLIGPEPSDLNPGGGPGPGSGSGLCPHPYLDGIYIDCDQLMTCPIGYEPWEGECLPVCPNEGWARDEQGICYRLEEDCDILLEDFKKAFPNASDADAQKIVEYLNNYGKQFGVETIGEMQHFLAQSSYESKGFTKFSESMYYTDPDQLVKYWPSIFSQTDTTMLDPDDYLKNTKKLANVAYANKYGNGSIDSGDGYKYRGRGIFQLTFKSQYEEFNDYYNNNFLSNKNFISNPELLSTDLELAVLSALWYYQNRVDKNDINHFTNSDIVTSRINKSTDSYEQRSTVFDTVNEYITKCLP